MSKKPAKRAPSITTNQKNQEPPMDPKEKLKNNLFAIQQKILEGIDQDQVKFPRKKIPYETEKRKKELQAVQLKELMAKKEKAKNNLSKLEEEEEELLERYNLSKSKKNYVTLSPARPKSQFTNSDVAKIYKLKKQRMDFEAELSEKVKAMEERERLLLKEQRDVSEKKRHEEYQKKKVIIAKRIEQMDKKREERYAKFEEEKEKLLKIKSQKKFYEEVANKWKNHEDEEEKHRQEQLKMIKKEKSFDMSLLKEHERKYDEMRKKNREDIEKKRQLIRENDYSSSRVGKSKFYTIILKEQKKKKEEQEHEKEEIRNKVAKRIKYAEDVRTHHPPKVHSHESDEEKDKGTEVRHVDPEEAKMKGLHFLQMAKLRKKKVNKNDEKFTNLSHAEESSKRSKYPNYLSETQKTKEKSVRIPKRTNQNYDKEVDEVKKIMKMTNFSDREKYEKVRIITDKIEQDLKNEKSLSLLKKIAAKLEIIESIY